MRTSEAGTTLVETIVALSIAVVIIGGITSLVITSLGNATYTKVQDQAESLAQEGIETVRQKANSNYSFFVSTYNKTNYCMGPDLSLIERAFDCNNYKVKTIYTREVTLTQGGDCGESNTKASVKVFWTDSRCRSVNCHKVALESCLVDNSTILSPGI